MIGDVHAPRTEPMPSFCTPHPETGWMSAVDRLFSLPWRLVARMPEAVRAVRGLVGRPATTVRIAVGPVRRAANDNLGWPQPEAANSNVPRRLA